VEKSTYIIDDTFLHSRLCELLQTWKFTRKAIGQYERVLMIYEFFA